MTGGGFGIGRELCRCFHAAGYSLVVVSLLAEELADLKNELDARSCGQEVITYQLDLSTIEAAHKVVKFCEEKKINVDVLVNNAGFGLAGRVVDQPLNRLIQLLSLNIVTTTILCHAFGNKMRELGSGLILNVASTISFQPLPFWAVYAGSKAYLSSFTQALASELRLYGINVSCLYPGITRTQFLDTAGIHQSRKWWSVGSMIHRAAMNPVSVARIGFTGLMRGKRRIVPGLINKLHFFFIQLIPNPLILAVVNMVMKRYRDPSANR
ncbi:MAG: SDR family NAD(P)-dependent oxidoreductase [Deltaproteobacteria bacterium]|nr:SDR family NAD(P)-dependent oxidoreductase [Deltaproteobacteria bacterium]